MNMVLFVGGISPEGKVLAQYLKENSFQCVVSSNTYEITQAGLQNERAILIFTGNKIPSQFLSDNSWSFPTLNILYLAALPKLTPEIKEKVKDLRLEIYCEATKSELLKNINEFWAGARDRIEIDELEFGIHKELLKVENDL